MQHKFERFSFQADMVASRERGVQSLVAAQVSGSVHIMHKPEWHKVLPAEGAANVFTLNVQKPLKVLCLRSYAPTSQETKPASGTFFIPSL